MSLFIMYNQGVIQGPPKVLHSLYRTYLFIYLDNYSFRVTEYGMHSGGLETKKGLKNYNT